MALDVFRLLIYYVAASVVFCFYSFLENHHGGECDCSGRPLPHVLNSRFVSENILFLFCMSSVHETLLVLTTHLSEYTLDRVGQENILSIKSECVRHAIACFTHVRLLLVRFSVRVYRLM